MAGALHGVLASLKAAAASATDAFFRYVTLLLNTTSTNGAQNNTFLDGSTNAFAITRNGNTTQGNFSPFSQTGWSNFFDGNGDYLEAPDNAAFAFGSGDFTIEGWIYLTAYAAADQDGLYNAAIYTQQQSFPTNSKSVLIYLQGTASSYTNIIFSGSSNNTTSTTITGSFTFALNTWYHVACVRNGNNVYLYVNGTQVNSTTAFSLTLQDSTVTPKIGAALLYSGFNYFWYFPGYISNLRIVKGTAVYTANFAPPTSPLTAITNTSLLTCQSNRFIDNSSNAFAITRNGDVSVQAFSPFNPTAAWSASTNGGSGYFDGTGDYLSAASNAAFNILSGGDFTVECWFYANALTSNSGFGSTLVSRDESTSLNGFIFRVLPTALEWVYPGLVSNSQSFTFVTNTWYHVAAVRSSGAFRLYINGTQYSPTYTDRTADFASSVLVGASAYTINQAFFNGYISGVRIVKGTAVYTANFTPPTAPLTAITNTSLLLNFTNAGIYDSASGNDLETVGNAQVSTTQAKWGTTSMAFDGTGDWLVAPNRQALRLGSADFTIEYWFYPTNLTGTRTHMNTDSGAGGVTCSYAILTSGSSLLFYLSSSGTTWNLANGVSMGTATLNTWQHVALVRSGSTFTPYLNGVAGTTATSTASLFNFTTPLSIGAALGGGAPVEFLGYIDDLRITNGYARYGFFTPPTSALTPTAYTGLLANTSTTNGAQNNTFLDGSTNNFSITRNGNTTQGTFSPFSNSGWSNYFDGTGDYLSIAHNTALNLSSGDFTIEAFVYWSGSNANSTIFDKDSLIASSYPSYNMSLNGSGFIICYVGSGNGTSSLQSITSSTALPANTWAHLAFVKNGTTLTLYQNGTSVASATQTATITDGGKALLIGYNAGQATGYYFNGYISNARLVKGTAVYTANFTPPTAPLTAITNTSLLTCQSNRFIDNSSNNFTITRNGDTSIQAFSPFTPATWSSTTNGGSGYFDGTGDSLVTPAGLNTAIGGLAGSTWTIESWVYVNSIAAGPYPTGFISCYQAVTANGRWYLGYEGTTSLKVRFVYTISTSSENVVVTTNSFALNAWHHIAVTIDATTASASTIKLFVDGVLQNTFTSQDLSTQGTNYEAPSIGGNASIYVNGAIGYITNVRMVKGSLVYTGNYTVPTAPLSAVTGTLLLLNFTNAGIYDAAGANNFETVGDAQVSTTQAKFGTTSMYFDGVADRLVMPARPTLAVGSGNFTIEGWVYRNDTSTRGVFQLSGTAGGLQANTTTNLALGSDAGAVWRIYCNNSAYNSTATWVINTWYHFALVRSSGVTTLYINGVSVITQADTVNYTGQNLCIGGFYDTTFLMNGYIDDLRITPGQALYTTNFTPPTAAFPVQ